MSCPYCGGEALTAVNTFAHHIGCVMAANTTAPPVAPVVASAPIAPLDWSWIGGRGEVAICRQCLGLLVVRIYDETDGHPVYLNDMREKHVHRWWGTPAGDVPTETPYE